MSKRDSKPDVTPAEADTTAKVAAPEGPDAWDAAGAWLAKYGALPVAGVITIIVALTFLPALALGPLAEGIH